MKINYSNEGDILYKAEQFRYRHQGFQSANVEVLTMIDSKDNNNSFAFQIDIEDDSVPKQYRKINSADRFLFNNLNPNMKNQTVFTEKEECLQNAVDWLSFIMEKYSDKNKL